MNDSHENGQIATFSYFTMAILFYFCFTAYFCYVSDYLEDIACTTIENFSGKFCTQYKINCIPFQLCHFVTCVCNSQYSLNAQSGVLSETRLR